jgi:uroporphyrinogen III methyltransferase/synthase
LPVALIRWATTGSQQTLRGRLDGIAALVTERGFSAPAIAVFGEVVQLRERLNWFESRALFGRRIVVTRTRKQAGALSESLRGLGADVWEIPTIRIEEPSDMMEFGQLVQDSHGYDWLIFTSANGVDAFFRMFFKLYDDARDIGGIRIAAIGPATAARVRELHLKVDLQPAEYVAESIVKAFKESGSIENLRMLLVRPEEARDVIPQELARLGAIVDEAIAYRTVPETGDMTGGIERLRSEGADLITFASSSSVENFMKLKLELPEGIKMASIGPVTSKTMRELGLTVDIEARRHDIPGLVEAIRRGFASDKVKSKK